MEDFFIRKCRRDTQKSKSDKLNIIKAATGKRLWGQSTWDTLAPLVAKGMEGKGNNAYIGVYASVVTAEWKKVDEDVRRKFDHEAQLLNEGKGTPEMKIL